MMTSKSQMLSELKTMLRDVFTARATGTATPRLARSHGYIDGYMRALMECGRVNKTEMLALVAEQRAIVFGPATSVSGDTEPLAAPRDIIMQEDGPSAAIPSAADAATSEAKPSVVAA